MPRSFSILVVVALSLLSTSAFAGHPRWRCHKSRCVRPACTTMCTQCDLAPAAAAYCTGTCNDGVSVRAYGYGDNLGQAQSDANGKISIQCASRGGVHSYDTCTPVRSGNSSASCNCRRLPTTCRTYAITESGNPAPSTGYYVEVLVLSTGRTWYYGPYNNYEPDGLAAFRALYNPSTQWTALPQYISAGTILPPW